MDEPIWERKSSFSKYFCLRKFSYGPTQNKTFFMLFPGKILWGHCMYRAWFIAKGQKVFETADISLCCMFLRNVHD